MSFSSKLPYNLKLVFIPFTRRLAVLFIFDNFIIILIKITIFFLSSSLIINLEVLQEEFQCK